MEQFELHVFPNRFHRFLLCENVLGKKKKTCLFAGWLLFTVCGRARRLVLVTLEPGLWERVSRLRTKCCACVRDVWCGANCPSHVHQSIVGLRHSRGYVRAA
ncbi:hypothetical protein AMECASPLE_026400 [Ameca splendens]|uniref:Uncharacterized protein n=1 Tax=Ameca splendens TaxID=208324 RepID=A0ABV0YRW5_9TELE